MITQGFGTYIDVTIDANVDIEQVEALALSDDDVVLVNVNDEQVVAEVVTTWQ